MEGRSHYSERKHVSFLDRFKGRVSSVGKNGHIGVAAGASTPIQKNVTKYSEVYKCSTFESTAAPYLLADTDLSTNSGEWMRRRKGSELGELSAAMSPRVDRQLLRFPTFDSCSGYGYNPSVDASWSQVPTMDPRWKAYSGEEPAPQGISRSNMQKIAIMSLADYSQQQPQRQHYRNHQLSSSVAMSPQFRSMNGARICDPDNCPTNMDVRGPSPQLSERTSPMMNPIGKHNYAQSGALIFKKGGAKSGSFKGKPPAFRCVKQ